MKSPNTSKMTQSNKKIKRVRFTLPKDHKYKQEKKKAPKKKYTSNFLVRKHPFGWHPKHHYMCMGGQCGQSCPCCRAELGDTFGACQFCKIVYDKKSEKKQLD
jgi:hypothetical protein